MLNRADSIAGNRKSRKLGYGVWLMTSATTAYTLFESDTESTTSSGIVKHPGCRICFIELKCGKQLSGDHIKIRSDLSTCEEMPAIKVNVEFPDPQLELCSEHPETDDMPYYSTKAEAGIAMLKEVRETLLDSPKLRDPKNLLEIARPITTKMTQLRPTLSREFDSHLSIRHSLVMSLISFAGSMLLHVIFVWIYHRYKHCNNATPLWCGLFCLKKSRTAVEPEQSNETQLPVVGTAPREYSQLARTISFSQQTLNKIATDAATETIKRTMSHASAPQQADRHYTYRAADVPEHYKSHCDIRCE